MFSEDSEKRKILAQLKGVVRADKLSNMNYFIIDFRYSVAGPSENPSEIYSHTKAPTC